MNKYFLLILSTFLIQHTFAQPQIERGQFESNGVEINYIESGEGEAVILAHGFTGSVDTWLRVGLYQSLAEKYRVVAFDARGHGLSGKPTDIDYYGKEMGRDIIRLMDHLDISSAHIVSYSMGSRLISVAITEYQSRFKSVVFGGRVPTWEWRATDEQTAQDRYKMLTANPSQIVLRAGANPLALALVQLGLKDMTIPIDEFKKLQIPMLAILGSEDPRLISAREFKSEVPSMELIVVEGENHGSTASHPIFSSSVQDFLSQN